MHTTKLDLAFDALEFANGNVSKAKAIIAESGVRISARTWHKAITARLAHLTAAESWGERKAYDKRRAS